MSSVSRTSRGPKLMVRAPRMPIDLKVQSRTIGSNVAYSLCTQDVSRSGLLLVWESEAKVPFIVNTLLELTIDPQSQCLHKPVTCLGKVVRREANTEGEVEGGTRFGIQIVQIDKTDQNVWEGCLGELERRFGIELTGPVPLAAAS